MTNITIYTKAFCPYCVDAKLLLTEKGQAFEEIDICRNPDLRPMMIDRTGGGSTVPQIFIGERHIGGCDDLYALERAGKLDALFT